MQEENNKINLTEEDFSFVCPLKTADMKNIEGGYFCGKCDKKVHDVSDYTPEAFNSLKEKSDNLCITFKKVAVVSLALSLSACTTTGKVASSKEPCQTKHPTTQDENNRLSPFKTPDKNQTVQINRAEESNIAGGIRAPMELREK